jgi:hypothetical protein
MALALTASYPGRRAGHNREMTGFRVLPRNLCKKAPRVLAELFT